MATGARARFVRVRSGATFPCRVAAFVVVAGAGLARPAAAQTSDSRHTPTVAGAVSVTNKGIPTVPTFTLGRPAVTFDIFIRHRRISVDPQIRYALDGVPWAFLFWLRYRALRGEKFDLLLGGHPAINLREGSVTVDGESRNVPRGQTGRGGTRRCGT